MAPDPTRVYRRFLRHRLGRHLRHTDLLARLTGRPWLVDVATAAARDDRRAFDRLVEIGLGAGTLDLPLATAMITAMARRPWKVP